MTIEVGIAGEIIVRVSGDDNPAITSDNAGRKVLAAGAEVGGHFAADPKCAIQTAVRVVAGELVIGIIWAVSVAGDN